MESTPNTLAEFLHEQEELTREQLAAAWQLQVERVEEQLHGEWRELLGQAIAARFADLERAAEAEVQCRLAACGDELERRAAAAAGRRASETLNRGTRRLDQVADAAEWASALADAVAGQAARTILFELGNGQLTCRAYRLAEGETLEGLAGLALPLAAAPAFTGVVETLDTVIAMRTAGELSAPLAALLGDDAERRVCLAPVVTGRPEEQRRVAAIVYAEAAGEPLDVNAVELLCGFAGGVLDGLSAAARARSQAAGGELMGIAPATVALPAAPVVLGPAEQEAHARAQRYARVRAAELRLHHPQAVRAGRAEGRLYVALQEQIDAARAGYREQFGALPGMPDYLHLELVRSLALEDPALLGEEYPGALA
jgi:hypothetical protein